MTDLNDKELKATDAGVDGYSSDESVAIEPNFLLDSKAEPPAAIPSPARPATNRVRKRREANPFKESTLVLPIRQEFYHSQVHEERNVEYYLHWVYSTSTVDIQQQCPKDPSVRSPRTIRGIGIVISRRLMAADTKLTQSEESPVENATQRNRSFEDLENAKQERPGFLWFLGYRIDAWIWYSKGWKVRSLKRWLKEHENERDNTTWLRPVQSSGDSVTLALDKEVSKQPEQLRDDIEPTEAAHPAQQAVAEDSDSDSLHTHESADTFTAAEQTTSTRTDFYNHPGVGLHSDSASQSDSSSTASASPPPSPPPSTLRRSKSLADLRSPLKPPLQILPLDPPRPQRFHSCLDVIGEDNEDEPPTSPDIASIDAFTSTSPETTSSAAIASHNDSGGEELSTLHSQQTTHAVSPSDARATKFHEELHSSSNAETSEATLHAASAVQDSDRRDGELDIVVTHSVSSGIKMRLERLAKSLRGAEGGKRPSGRPRRDSETASGSATGHSVDRGGGLRRSLSRRLSSQSKRLSKGE